MGTQIHAKIWHQNNPNPMAGMMSTLTAKQVSSSLRFPVQPK